MERMDQLYQYGYSQNRDLSWLRFNDRVLSQAMDETVPLLEQLKFLAIFTSNLDEFFMIRVGSLFDLCSEDDSAVDSKSGLRPSQQLEQIFQAVRPLYRKREELFARLEEQLRCHGVYHLRFQELDKGERACVRQYYETSIAPVLSPQIVDVQHPFPHLANKVVHIGVMLKRKNRRVFGVIPLPDALPDQHAVQGRPDHTSPAGDHHPPGRICLHVILPGRRPFCNIPGQDPAGSIGN